MQPFKGLGMRAKLADTVAVGQHCAARSLAGTYSGLASRFLIKTHDWRQNHPLRTTSNFATNSTLTHSSDLRRCVNTWESVWLLRRCSFILKRQVCLFLGQALSCCTQPGLQRSSSPFSLLLFFPFFHNDILEPPFDAPRPHLNIAYSAVYLRMFSYVYFLQSVPHRRPHTRRQTGAQTRTVHLFFSPSKD